VTLSCGVGRLVCDRRFAASVAGSVVAIAMFACVSASPSRAERIVASQGGLVPAQSAPPRSVAHRSAEPPEPKRPLRAALLVGVDNAPGSDPLPGSRADAHTMRRALLMYGFDPRDIIMLLDEQATRGNILAAIDELAAGSFEDSITVISFSAHSVHTAGGPTMRAWDARLRATEIAEHMRPLRGRVWSVFATCYAGGYVRPGVVGPDRITVFSSRASDTSLQLGDAGSFIVLYMARYAMLEREAPATVESAFRYAREHIALSHRPSLPFIDDRIRGELALGPLSDVDPPETAHTRMSAARAPKPATPSPRSPPPLTDRLLRFPQNAPVSAPLACSSHQRACRKGPA
jgi:hypothetical protein